MRFARATVGPEFMIACDANQGWTPDEAIDFCRRVKDWNVRWFEEPVKWYDQLRGLATVRAHWAALQCVPGKARSRGSAAEI